MPRVRRIRGGRGAEGLSHHPSMQRFPQGREISLLLSTPGLGSLPARLLPAGEAEVDGFVCTVPSPSQPIPPCSTKKKRKEKNQQALGEERKRIQRCMEE